MAVQSKKDRTKCLFYVLRGLRDYETHLQFRVAAVQRDPFGRPCQSWRVAVMGFVEQCSGPREPNVPWFDPRNQASANTPNWLYCFFPQRRPPESLYSQVWAVTGPGTAFDGEEVHRFSELPNDLILLLEAGKSTVHWMAPGDLDVRDVPSWLPAGSVGDGLAVAFADGEAWFLSPEVTTRELSRFFTIESAQTCDRQSILGPYCLLRHQPSRGFW